MYVTINKHNKTKRKQITKINKQKLKKPTKKNQ